MGELNYHVHDNVDYVFEEKGNTFSAIRKIQWLKANEVPDESKSYLELRKWYVGKTGETPGKGFTFSTPDGPHNLTETLVGLGYGDTKKIIKELKNRDDFKESVETLYNIEEDDSDGIYFDAREALLCD